MTMVEGIGITISWSYTSNHRYESDLDAAVRDVVAKLVADTNSTDDGEAGGSGFSDDPTAMVADSSIYLIVPTLEAGNQIKAAVDRTLKLYDERYSAKLETTS